MAVITPYKFHRFLFPFSSKFSDLNFAWYVFYNLPVLCHVSHTVCLGYLWKQLQISDAPRKQTSQFNKIFLKTTSGLPCEQLVSPTPNERETTASNRLLFHRACVSSSRPTWCIWCQVHLSIIFFAGSVSVQKKQNVSHQKRCQKNDSNLTVFLLSFYENDSAVLTEKNAISSRLLRLPTVNSAFYSYGTKKPTKCFKGGVSLPFIGSLCV